MAIPEIYNNCVKQEEVEERKEMQNIRKKAEKNAAEVPSKLWKRAYLRLADAADKIDAMIARTEEKED